MRSKLLLFVVLGLAVATSACDAFPIQEPPNFDPPPAQAPGASPSVATYQVRRGSISGEMSLRGRVVAVQEVPLFFKTDGWIKEIRVSVGDQIEQGTLIAEMESPSLQREVEDAQYRLDLARVRLAFEKEAPSVDKVAVAMEGVEQASVALERARLSLAKLMAPPTAEEIDAAKVAVERAKNALWATQEERDGIKGNPSAAQYQGAAAEARVAVAETVVKSTMLDLEIKLKGPKPEDVALAKNAVAASEASLAAAQTSLEYEKAVRALNLANRQLSLSTAQQEAAYRGEFLQSARERLRQTILVAPFSGALVSLDAKIGDSVKPFSPIGILADPSLLQMEANVPDELMDNVLPGMPAKMVLDVLGPERALTGKVSDIADKATTWQGKNVHRVTIAFDQGARVPSVMRMGSDITLQGKTKGNALLVPKDAVTADGERRYVRLVVEGKEKRVEVRTGLSNSDWVEVISGLDEGDLVSVARPTGGRT